MEVAILVLLSILLLGIGAMVPGVTRSFHKIVVLVQEMRAHMDVQGSLSSLQVDGQARQVADVRDRVANLEQSVDGVAQSLGMALVSVGSQVASLGNPYHQQILLQLTSLQCEALAGQLQRLSAETALPTPGLPALPRLRRRSVVFLHNSYYHFYYLVQALRRRGWDAVSVSIEAPDGPHAPYYHGQDLILHSSHPATLKDNTRFFLEQAHRRFDFLHFATDGWLSFYPENYGSDEPQDIVEWRGRGKKIGYTVSGCSSCVSQSAVNAWSTLGGQTCCDVCVWQNRPDVCADDRNRTWGRKVDTYCDVIFGEGVPALDCLAGPKAIREPVTTCLDPAVWHPHLQIPGKFQLDRKDGEILIYHAVGNFDVRARGKRNLKGTQHVVNAVDRLKDEGHPVRLVFVTGVRNIDVKYTQAQADVVVDQLHYGRYGANCREAMMLGKPVICYLNRHELRPEQALRCLEEIPVVSATPQTLYDELKNLVLDPNLRRQLGALGREYAVKWHGVEACAERYERIYDALMATGEVPSTDAYLHRSPDADEALVGSRA